MIDNDSMKTRFIAVLEASRITQAEVAAACGVSEQAVSAWKRMGRIDKRHYAKLSELFAVPIGYWLGEDATVGMARATKPVKVHAYGIRAVEGDDGVDPATDVMVPVYDIEVAGGPGTVVPEFVETKYRLPFQAAWLNDWDAKEDDIMVARVRGSSMEPVLYDGDKVVIHTKRKRIRNECVYSLIYGGEARVKRLFNLADGSLRIVSDNPDKNRYPDELVPAADRDQVFILGQVIDKMGNGGLGF